ncbi:MAG: beta-lactamase family protein [Flavobacteriales bacterium]|nr:beta-lactamase family protein [Flavobacteriales bacterium]
MKRTTIVLMSTWLLFGCDLKAPKINISLKEAPAPAEIGVKLDSLHGAGEHAGAVVVMREGEVWGQWFHGVERSGGDRVSGASMFRLASVSKQFTVAGVLTAVGQGRLALDDDIRVWLLECPYEGVTVRHLMQHVSGIPDFYMDLPIPDRGFLGIADVVAALPDAPPMERAAGAAFEYSNTGYVLLAGLLERVYGRPFEELMMAEVFEPAGLECTRVWNLFSKDKDWLHKTWSMEGVDPNAPQIDPTELDGVAGDGGAFMCAQDAARWNAWWTSNAAVPDSIRLQAFQPAVLSDGSQSDYGFGWSLPDAHHVAHSGGWLGARTWWWRSLDGQDAVVVFNHTGSEYATEVGRAIRDALW